MQESEWSISLSGEGSVYTQIEHAIRSEISARRLRPGDRIPSEHDLIRILGVSRATINKALQSLAADGLIVRHRRLGSYVAEHSEAHAVFGFLDVRETIARSARQYAFEIIEQGVHPAREAPMAWPEVSDGTHVLSLLGVHLGDGHPEVVERRLINLKAAPEAADVDFAQEPPSQWLLKRLPCTRIWHEVASELCRDDDAKLLGVRPRSALLVSNRKTWWEDMPVTNIRLCYPGDRHRFVGEFNPLDR